MCYHISRITFFESNHLIVFFSLCRVPVHPQLSSLCLLCATSAAHCRGIHPAPRADGQLRRPAGCPQGVGVTAVSRRGVTAPHRAVRRLLSMRCSEPPPPAAGSHIRPAVAPASVAPGGAAPPRRCAAPHSGVLPSYFLTYPPGTDSDGQLSLTLKNGHCEAVDRRSTRSVLSAVGFATFFMRQQILIKWYLICMYNDRCVPISRLIRRGCG